MNYGIQTVARRLREARQGKNLSQRALGNLAGVPQAQISRIEAGNIDLRLSSLRAIANALDLEIVLVPRKALPAVHSLIRQTSAVISPSNKPDAPRPLYSLDDDVADSATLKEIAGKDA